MPGAPALLHSLEAHPPECRGGLNTPIVRWVVGAGGSGGAACPQAAINSDA